MPITATAIGLGLIARSTWAGIDFFTRFFGRRYHPPTPRWCPVQLDSSLPSWAGRESVSTACCIEDLTAPLTSAFRLDESSPDGARTYETAPARTASINGASRLDRQATS